MYNKHYIDWNGVDPPKIGKLYKISNSFGANILVGLYIGYKLEEHSRFPILKFLVKKEVLFFRHPIYDFYEIE